jgi:2-enoate reductase
VRLGTKATAAAVSEESPDVVVVATGAAPVVPSIPGIEKKCVAGALEVLMGEMPAGDRVLVAGGGIIGCEAAVFMAEHGKSVTVADMLGILSSEPVFVLNQASLLALMEKRGIQTMAGAELLEVVDGGALVRQDGSSRVIECDAVVLALGLQADVELARGLERLEGFEVRVIGDNVKPRKVLDAVWEGFHAGRLI